MIYSYFFVFFLSVADLSSTLSFSFSIIIACSLCTLLPLFFYISFMRYVPIILEQPSTFLYYSSTRHHSILFSFHSTAHILPDPSVMTPPPVLRDASTLTMGTRKGSRLDGSIIGRGRRNRHATFSGTSAADVTALPGDGPDSPLVRKGSIFSRASCLREEWMAV